MLDGLDNASIEIKEAKVCLDSYILLFFFFLQLQAACS